MAPEAQILFSLAPSPGDADLQMALADAINYEDVRGTHVAAISISWGNPCDTGQYGAIHAGYDALFLSAQALGIPVVVASGDTGIFCQGSTSGAANPSISTTRLQNAPAGATATPSATATPPLVNPVGYAAAPANSAWALAVGGTSLSMDPATYAWRGETAWSCTPGNDSTCALASGGASGGGLSGYASDGQPIWQGGRIPAPDGKFDPTLVQQYTRRRAVPDISTDGDPATGLVYVAGGTFTTAGGTSAAAPWVAGALALASQAHERKPLGFVTPFLYANCPAASWCNDVTSGYNGESARAGWDYTSGLGSIKDYGGFVAALAGTAPPSPVPTYTPTGTATPIATAAGTPPSAAPTSTPTTTSTATATPVMSLYVNGDIGNDNDACTSVQPCKTINHAINRAGSSRATICIENPYLSSHCKSFNPPSPTSIAPPICEVQFCFDEDLVIDTSQKLTIMSDPGVQDWDTYVHRGRKVTVRSGATATTIGLTIIGQACGGIDNEGSLTLSNSIIDSSGTQILSNSCSSGGGIFNRGTLLLSNTSVSGNSTSGPGGGIFNRGTLTLSGSTVNGNSASGPGGGIFNQGTLTLSDSTVSAASAKGAGGGIFNQGTLTLSDSTVSAASAKGAGGGIFNQGTLTLSNSTVSGNSASAEGGGIANGGILVARTSTITINNATGSGGGIFNEQAGTVTLGTSTVSNNDADQGGGGIDNAGRLSLLDSALTGNATDDGSGGGILDEGRAEFTAANSTLVGNMASSPAGNGGGIASLGAASVTLLNATVSGNSASHGAGGGIDNQGSGALVVKNSILSSNAAQVMANADCAGTGVSGGYNLLSAEDGCPFVATDQYAGPPTTTGSLPRSILGFSYHGGATETLQLAPDSADSNAIHHGDPAVCQAAPIDGKDQRGLPRGPRCDIGAYDTFGDRFASTTFYVDQIWGSDTAGCTSPGTGACKTIGAALVKASGGGTIEIASGVYREHLAIRQSYLSLEGSGAGVVLDGNNTGTVVTVEPGTTIDLTGIVIRNGVSVGVCPPGPPYCAGGITNYGTLALFNSTVSHNSADSGGGIYNGGTLLVSQSTISANTAVYAGGGIANQTGALRMRDNSLVTGNESLSGGGIDSTDGSLLITDSTISNNGVMAQCPFLTCFQPIGGGIANNDDSVLLLKRSTVTGNQSGGVYSAGITEVTNATVSNNNGCGGGIEIKRGAVTLINSTITSNGPTVSDALIQCGGGISDASDGAASIALTNTVVLLNNAAASPGPDCSFANPPAGGNNLFSTNGDCRTADDDTNVRIDPAAAHLGPPGNYGGTTQTVQPRLGSPAIRAGNGQVCAASPVDGVDQRGALRAPRACDIGAYDTFGDAQSPISYYVDATLGDDANSCLSPVIGTMPPSMGGPEPMPGPCKTIGAAIRKASDGASISIAPAIYPEILNLSTSVTLSGSGPGTVLDGQYRGTVVTVQSGATVHVQGITLRDGAAGTGDGGGIANYGALTLDDSTVSASTARNGGGILNAGSLQLTNSTISGTMAGSALRCTKVCGTGGGIDNLGSLTVSNSTISSNTAMGVSPCAGDCGNGGGISTTGSLTLANSTLGGNKAGSTIGCATCGSGGGIYADYRGAAHLDEVTISGNTADGGGGVDNRAGSVWLRNTILAGNTLAARADGQGPECRGILTSGGYNLVGNGSGCTLNSAPGDQVGNDGVPIDPMLGTLQVNGGLTPTMALQPGSPAIETGTCTDATGAVVTGDQRGAPRPDVPNTPCDIGAYEYQVSPAPCPPAWTCTDIGSPDPAGSQSLIDGTWTVQGTGSGLAGRADQLHFIGQPWSAPVSVAAHLVAQSATPAGAQAGVVVRQTMDTSAPFYALVRQGNTIRVVYRTRTGLPAVQAVVLPAAVGSYLKVTCVSLFSTRLLCVGSVSQTGTIYRPVPGQMVWATSQHLLAGLAVSAGSDGRLNSVIISSVHIVRPYPHPLGSS
jgi:hypothetical protein